MARHQYFVVLHNDEWKISYQGKHYGPYRTQGDAITAARRAAHATAQKGLNAQVLVQGENNKFRTEWTYGNDPFPPAG